MHYAERYCYSYNTATYSRYGKQKATQNKLFKYQLHIQNVQRAFHICNQDRSN